MTREENLHWLNEEIRTWENECQSKHPIKEALYAARKALEQEPCNYAISLETAIEWLKTKDIIKMSSQEETARRELKALPSVNLTKTGKRRRPTNGDMIKALFPYNPYMSLIHEIALYADESKQSIIAKFPVAWWDAPYKEEQA